MTKYASIREDVLRKMAKHMPEIRERFGVKSLALFGSVSHAEDTPNSDVDILYEFLPGEATLAHLVDLGDFLEEVFHRKVDLVAVRALSPYLREDVIAEAVYV